MYQRQDVLAIRAVVWPNKSNPIIRTGPSIAQNLGLEYVRAMVRDGDVNLKPPKDSCIDCGIDGALCWEAIQMGFRYVVFSGRIKLRNQLLSIAKKKNVKILPKKLPSISMDLSEYSDPKDQIVKFKSKLF